MEGSAGGRVEEGGSGRAPDHGSHGTHQVQKKCIGRRLATRLGHPCVLGWRKSGLSMLRLRQNTPASTRSRRPDPRGSSPDCKSPSHTVVEETRHPESIDCSNRDERIGDVGSPDYHCAGWSAVPAEGNHDCGQLRVHEFHCRGGPQSPGYLVHQ